MERIGFAQGLWSHEVDLKFFAGVCFELIVPVTMGSANRNIINNTTHGTAAHETDTLLSHFHLMSIGLLVKRE